MAAADSITNSNFVDTCINWTVQHFSDEVAAVKGAPLFFLASVGIVALVIYWLFHRKLSARDDLIQQLEKTRDDLRVRLDLAVDDLRKVAALPAPQNDPGLAKQIGELKAEIEKRDRQNWRGLAMEEKQALAFAVQRITKTSIGFTYNMNPDCEVLACDFRDVFVNVGWNVIFLGSGTWASLGTTGVQLLVESEAMGCWLSEAIQRTVGINVTFRVEAKQTPANLLIVGPKRLIDTQPKADARAM